MASLQDVSSINKFPSNIAHQTEEDKKRYSDSVFGKFIDEYLLQKTVTANGEEDYVSNYAMCYIFLTILIFQLKYTVAEADSERNLINQKLLLSVFKSMGAYSKYAIDMFVSIAQIECMFTPHMSQEFKWGFFVSWRGGAGKKMEDDIAQEIFNRVNKSVVQGTGPNKTFQSISKVCKAINGINEVMEQFDASVRIHQSAVQHTTPDSLKDEKEMVKDLVELDPFRKVPERCHNSFPDIKRCLLRYLNIVEFHQWLDKHKRELSNIN